MYVVAASEKLSERKKSRCLLRQSHKAVERPRSTMLSIKAFFVFSSPNANRK